MCELFGLSANKVVKISFTWRGFRRRGRIHRDGWGVAWYLDGGLVGLVKEPRPAPSSPIAGLLLGGVRSRVVVSHVRLASRGGVSYVNTHPFVRRFLGRDWVFAHNGDVSGIVGRPGYGLRWCSPAGDTDSEYAFCYLLERLRDSGAVRRGVERLSRELWETAEDVGTSGKFNFLLSDGTHLFAYSNREGTLYYLKRHPPHLGSVGLADEDYEARLEELKAPDERAVIVATKPLTDEDWSPVRPHTLHAFRDGDPVLSVGG